MPQIRKHTHEEQFLIIDNSAIQDKRLSWKARGLLCYMLSMPQDWDFNVRDLENRAPEGYTALRSGLEELETYGYLERRRAREEDGTYQDMIWDIYEVPVSPRSENPNLDNPGLENPNLQSTHGTKDTSCREPLEVHEPSASDLPEWVQDLNPVLQSAEETCNEIVNTLTVSEIKRLDLPREWWQLMYEAEKANKDRVTAKRHIKQMLENRPPSVDVYREIAETFPKKALWDLMGRVVGSDENDLEFWRKVVTAYVACGWNPRNVENMLRYFRDRTVPTTNGDMNGRKPRQKPKPERTEGERARIEWRRKELAKITGNA